MRGFVVILAGLAFASAANAAPPAVSASASPASGSAPLRVTLTATGDAAGYSWDLGDGATAAGAVVEHVYAPGRWVATVTATSATGESAQARVVVTAVELSLSAPGAGDYEAAVVLSGRLRPVRPGARIQIYRGRTHVTTAVARAGGRYRTAIRLRRPGRYRAVYAGVSSPERAVRVRPRLVVSSPETVAAGTPPTFTAELVPRSAGTVAIRVRAGRRTVGSSRGRGSARLRVKGRDTGLLRVHVTSRPSAGFMSVRRSSATRVVLPDLARGSRGPSVLALERRLQELRYALRGVDAVYGPDTVEAVLAFQKVHGLPRTGRVGASLWGRLAAAHTPPPRHGTSDHIEIDKSSNVLYEVTGGRINRIVHVSTGATGNTPLGTFHVYRTVPGWDWVLWYPLYFLRGFAIHGYPSVPAYPASHGCVRVPMWIAPSLFARHGHGARIVVFA